MAQSDNGEFWIPQAPIADKVCTKCRQRKPVTEFDKWPRPNGTRTRRYLCKECRRSYNRNRWKNRVQKNPRCHLNKHLRRVFGISLEEYERMEQAQQGLCAICKCKCPHRKRLCVDHDHKTKKVRGLLCDPCNRGIEALKDSPEVLRAAAAYLEKFA